jgi:hypothetical protein
MSIWKLISIQSPANHGYYHGDCKPGTGQSEPGFKTVCVSFTNTAFTEPQTQASHEELR